MSVFPTSSPVHAVRHVVSVCAAALFVALSAGASVGRAAESLGTLSAGSDHFTWTTTSGDTITGRHDNIGILPRDREALAEVFTASGLLLARGPVAAANLLMTATVSGRDHAAVTFALAGDGDFREDLLWAAGEDVVVEAGEDPWPGSVLSFGGRITVSGEVIGSIVAIGADVILKEGTSVGGDVIVIGGVLRQEGDGTIYGGIFAPGGHRRPRLTITREWEFEDEGLGWRPVLSYDRVDGFRGGVRAQLRGQALEPQLGLLAAYAFASETWQYQLEVRQRLSRSINLEAVGTLFRLTETDDERWVGRNENTAYALVAGSDYRDYIGVDGGAVKLIYKFRERGVLSLGYRNTDYRWLNAHRNLWHLFRPDHDFRRNFSTAGIADPLADEFLADFEQHTSAIILRFGIEPVETNRQAVGFNGAFLAVYEVAGGGLGGGLDYDRLTLEGRGWWDTGRWHRLFLRLFYGAGRRDLPVNRMLYLGGVGSLRGYSQKAFVGNEAILATIEYRFNYWESDFLDGGVILFFDTGRAANSGDFWDLSEFKSDVGLGLGLGDGIRVDIAKGLDRADRDLKVTVRFTSPLQSIR